MSHGPQLRNYRIEALCECSDDDKKGEPRCVLFTFQKLLIIKVLTLKTLVSYFVPLTYLLTTQQLYNLCFIY